MDQLEALLPGICDYLEHALSGENLSEECELKRKCFVEKLELLDIGFEPPPDTPTPIINTHKSLSLPTKQVATGNHDYYEVPNRLQTENYRDKISQVEDKTHMLTEPNELALPKRSHTQRFSGNTHLLEQPWTLVGPLYHRYKANKWQRLAFSLLAGARLLCYKWTRSLAPSLNVFLYGHTAIYAGRDSGMDHVIKLTHPSSCTYVLAADTEKQALHWTAQINQYAQGLTPTKVISFMEDESKEHCDDNVFAGLASSSSSEGGSSGDGIIGQHNSGVLPSKSASQSRLSMSSTCSPQHHLIHQHNNSILSSSSNGSSPGHVPTSSSVANLTACKVQITDPLISAANSSIQSASTLLRSGGNIISTMRRKVESLGNRRKSRVFQFTPAKNSIITGAAKIRLPSQSHWHERWCQLTPGLLEAFKAEASESPQLDFALSLSQIVLDVSNDKKHPSALRLSSTSCSSEVLLFEVVDKDKMGEWIRAFISALGIIPTENPSSKSSSNFGATSQPSHDENSPVDPIYDEVCPPNSIALQQGVHAPLFRQRPAHIPPPSRQLLAQPLPTVPSISSKATSLQSVLTGRTRTSSRNTGNPTGNCSSDDTTSSDTLTVIGDGGSCLTVGQPCPSMMTSIISYADSIVLTGNNSDEEEDMPGTLERQKNTPSRRVIRRASVSDIIERKSIRNRYCNRHYGHIRTSLSCSNLIDLCNQTCDAVTPVAHSNDSTLSRRMGMISARPMGVQHYNTDTICSNQTAYSIETQSAVGHLATEDFDSDEETDLDNEGAQEFDSDLILIDQATFSSSDRWCAALEPYLDWADMTLERKSARANRQMNPQIGDSQLPSLNVDHSVVGCTLADLIARFECQSGRNPSCEFGDPQDHDPDSDTMLLEEQASKTLPHVRDSQNQQQMRRCVSSDNGFPRVSPQTAASTSTSSSRYSVDSADSSSRLNSIRKCTLRRTSVEIATEEMEALKLDVCRLRRKRSDLRKTAVDSDDCSLLETIEAIEQEIVLKSNRIEALHAETNQRHLYYVNAVEDKTSNSNLPASIESSAETPT